MLHECLILSAIICVQLPFPGSFVAMTKKFHDLNHYSDADIQAALGRNDPDELALMPITVALLAEDPADAQDIILRLAGHENIRVRSHALAGLGHLARRFRTLEEQKVKPLIESALMEQDEYIRMHARSAADEIHQFLHWTFANHEYGI
ncbi:MAG TPA: hypothetical protein DCS42_01365 [Nitrospiraceae bacterium]|nr:hypothetical protein [Nitrospiraceae bacterium]HAS52848.1 hypothetical protein [Nitrospiraceae bacterium]